jgi:hypothetical protein
MPTPNQGESHDDFISRCVPIVIDDGTADSPEQAVAVCNSIWDRRNAVTANQQQRYVRLTGLADGAAIRTATFDGATHLVIPVVALVGNTVVHSINAPDPEFVPAEVLAVAPKGWNGRPVVPDHPDGGQSSANEPRTLETRSFGLLFNTEFVDNKLKTEAWLDPERADAVGEDAQRVIGRGQAGEMIEVSIGAFVVSRQSAGNHNGQRYEAVWDEIIPDHLAMLPEGAEGACNEEMGCGAPRLNQAVIHRSDTGTTTGAELRAANKEKRMSMKETIQRALAIVKSGLVRSAQEDSGVSDSALRESLWEALRAVEPGFDGVVDVFPDSLTVIYTAFPEQELLWLRRSFSVSDGDKVALNDDREQVEPVVRYEPVTTAESNPVAAAAADDLSAPADQKAATTASCDCDQGAVTNKGESDMSDKLKELVGRLIASEASPFTSEDEERLSAFCEEKLLALEESFTPPEEDPKEAAKPTEVTEEEPKTDEELLAELPESLRSMVERHQAEEERYRGELVAAIAKAQDAYDEGQLKEKTTEDLQALASALKLQESAPDYSGRGLAIDDSNADVYTNPPDPYAAGLAKLRGEKAEAN